MRAPSLPTSDRPVNAQAQTFRSILAACGMYVMWGAVLPVYWRAIHGLDALETLAHRIVWGAALLFVLMRPTRIMASVGDLWRRGRPFRFAVLGAAIIASNWLIYIWGIRERRMLEASLGYYIGPLMSMWLGRAVLGERLRPLQTVSGFCAAAGVGYLVLLRGVVPVFGLALALTFSAYSLVRKMSGLRGVEGFTIETVLMCPFALAYLVWLQCHGTAQFFQAPLSARLLLMGSGVLGSVPLILFGVAAQGLRLTTLGMLQFLAPTLGFFMALVIYREPFNSALAVAFGGIWLGLGLWVADSLMMHSPRRPG